jgi:hypothetical protein
MDEKEQDDDVLLDETDETEHEEGEEVVETGDESEVVAQTSPEVEAEARKQGWVSLEEWTARGKSPDEHRSAEEFVEVGRRSIPILQKRLDTAERLLAEQRAEQVKRYERLERSNKKAMELQRKKIESEFEAKIRTSVEEGDVDTFDRLTKDRDEAVKAFDEPEDEPEKPETDPVAVAWIDANSWFKTDDEMRAVADARFNKSRAENPNADLSVHLAAARKRVVEKFPEAFPGEQPRERTMADLKDTVESGSRNGSGKTKKTKAADLPAEARKAGTEFVAQGLYKDLEAYAAAYFED